MSGVGDPKPVFKGFAIEEDIFSEIEVLLKELELQPQVKMAIDTRRIRKNLCIKSPPKSIEKSIIILAKIKIIRYQQIKN